jgi:hypothetical protein
MPRWEGKEGRDGREGSANRRRRCCLTLPSTQTSFDDKDDGGVQAACLLDAEAEADAETEETLVVLSTDRSSSSSRRSDDERKITMVGQVLCAVQVPCAVRVLLWGYLRRLLLTPCDLFI